MAFEIKDPPEFTCDVEQWTRQTKADGAEMAEKVIKPLLNNDVFLKKGIDNLTSPEFDDSGEVEEITGLPQFLEKVKSKMNIFQFYRDFKAGMKFVLHAGQIVNNCESERTDLPLAAKQGKELMDLYTQLYVNFGYHVYDGDWNDMPTGIWETSSGDLNSPEGNDGHYYRVFCKANSFQQAYRIASSAESSLAYFRYCNNGTWRNWYKPYISNADIPKLAIPWYTIEYNNDNKSDAVNILNNPTIILGNITSPFCFLFRDTVGDSPLSGGVSCVFGYAYAGNNYGTQLAVRYDSSTILIRNQHGGQWSDWKIITSV